MPVKVGDRVSVYISQPVPLNIDQNVRKCMYILKYCSSVGGQTNHFFVRNTQFPKLYWHYVKNPV